MFWSHKTGGRLNCPDCGGVLKNEHHVYLIAVRESGRIDSFIAGTDAGAFFGKLVTVGVDDVRNVQFMAFGLVDLQAIPTDKSSMPIGSDDNPVPLVKFTNPGQHGLRRKAKATASGRRKPRRAKK